MARSYKKNPIVKDHGAFAANYGNRILRRMHKRGDYSVPDGKAYRFTVNPYDVCDHRSRETWEEHVTWVESKGEASYGARRLNFMSHAKDPDEIDWKNEYRSWYTSYKMK